MLGDITRVENIYMVCGYTDMRKAIDGLCAVVKETVKRDPKENALFLFCGKRCDRIKAILHESDGFVLLYKRLDSHVGRYQWPRSRNEVKSAVFHIAIGANSGIESMTCCRCLAVFLRLA